MHPVTEELKLLIESGYPLIYLLTHEEERASRLVAEVMTELGLKAGIWSRTGGVQQSDLNAHRGKRI